MTFARKNLASLVWLGVVLALVLLFFKQQSQQSAQVAACERGNVIRTQMNTIGATLSSFLLIAASGRDDSSAEWEAKGDHDRALADKNLAQQYRALVPSLTALTLTNCSSI